MKALLIDVQRDTVEYVEPQGLADFYRLIDCDLIDITCREITAGDTILFVMIAVGSEMMLNSQL